MKNVVAVRNLFPGSPDKQTPTIDPRDLARVRIVPRIGFGAVLTDHLGPKEYNDPFRRVHLERKPF